jgi:OMF family outer membrane factor
VLLGLFAGCAAVEGPVSPEEIHARMVDPAVNASSSGAPPAVAPPRTDAPPAGPSVLPDLDKLAAPQEFSLREAVSFGLRNSPRLRAAYAAIERARGQEQVAFAPFLPQLDFLSHSGVTTKALGPASSGITGIILPFTTGAHTFAQAELQLQWTLCDFGRTRGRYRQAGARETIAQLRYSRARETVAFDVAAAFLQALRAHALRIIQEDSIRRAEAILKDTRSRRAAGVAEREDVLRAEVQLATAQDALDLAEEAEWAGLARLNNVMGRNASLPLQLVDWPAAGGPPGFSLSLVQCLEIAAAQRLELGVAREVVAAAQSGRQASAAEFLPRVYAAGVVGGVTGSNLQRGTQEGAGIHIDMPLYGGGRRCGELRSADAEVEEALAEVQTILDGVTLEVTLAYRSAVTARRRIDHLRPAVTEARENLRLLRNRYRNGNATPTDIVDAETALTGAQQRLSSATYEYLAALVYLDYALGSPQGQLLDAPDAPERLPEPPQTVPMPRPVLQPGVR